MNVNIGKKYKRGNLAKTNTPIKFTKSKKVKDLVSKRFGKLLVLKYLGINSNRNSVWKCQCDCGEITNASSVTLVTGLKISCGCITNERISEIDRKKSVEIVGPKKIYKQYKSQAKGRKLEFNLSLDKVTSLILDNCYYCGATPENKFSLSCGRIFLYNGIDRVDNTKGYITDNVLACCAKCNYMKSDMEMGEFASYIVRLINYSKNWIK